jgi:hypothetical protein
MALGLVAACLGMTGCASRAAMPPQIEGAVNPCRGAVESYRLCKTADYPFHWRWSVNADAIVEDMGVQNNCYHAQVTVGRNPITLTFRHINPVNLPQWPDIAKYIVPRQCQR